MAAGGFHAPVFTISPAHRRSSAAWGSERSAPGLSQGTGGGARGPERDALFNQTARQVLRRRGHEHGHHAGDRRGDRPGRRRAWLAQGLRISGGAAGAPVRRRFETAHRRRRLLSRLVMPFITACDFCARPEPLRWVLRAAPNHARPVPYHAKLTCTPPCRGGAWRLCTMPRLLPISTLMDLLEFSVVYHRPLRSTTCPERFTGVMRDILRPRSKRSTTPHTACWCPAAAHPAHEAVARQFANRKRCSSCATAGSATAGRQIFDAQRAWAVARWCAKARQQAGRGTAAPCPADEVAATIRAKVPGWCSPACEQPAASSCHDDHHRTPTTARCVRWARCFVLDCMASGRDVGWTLGHRCGRYHQRARKGWSSSPCCAMVMLSLNAHARPSARARRAATDATSKVDADRWGQKKANRIPPPPHGCTGCACAT